MALSLSVVLVAIYEGSFANGLRPEDDQHVVLHVNHHSIFQLNQRVGVIRNAHELNLGGVDHAESNECGQYFQGSMTKGDLSTVRYSLGTETQSSPTKDPRVIVDIGGNQGQDIEYYVHRFPWADIFTYEPVADFSDEIQDNFEENPNVHVYNIGAASEPRHAIFTLNGGGGVATSELNSTATGPKEEVKLDDIDHILQQVKIKTGQAPDALSLNCEGCEYEVMRRMADKGWLDAIPFIQLSWHIVDGVMNRKAKRCAVESKLKEQFQPVFWSDFGWTGWKRNEKGHEVATRKAEIGTHERDTHGSVQSLQ